MLTHPHTEQPPSHSEYSPLSIVLSGWWRRRRHPTPVLLPGKSHGWRSLVGCSPWGREESGMTERLHFPFSLSCIREGNGNPLQCSCLEIPRDGGAWWAAVYGVAQSWTWLKLLSSSSISVNLTWWYYNIILWVHTLAYCMLLDPSWKIFACLKIIIHLQTII